MRKKIDSKKTTRTRKKLAEPPAYRPFATLAKRKAGSAKSKTDHEAPKVALARETTSAVDRASNERFPAYAKDVRPLGGRAKRIPRTASELCNVDEGSQGPAASADESARAVLHAIVSDAIRFDVTDDGTCLEGRRLDVDPRELRRLRTLRYTVDGKLDLHGLSAAEARKAVVQFLRKRATEGDRAVMLVHGKGTHSPRGDAVLRGEIGAWLSQGSASRHVLAFASVLDRGGESGSLFVLLTR